MLTTLVILISLIYLGLFLLTMTVQDLSDQVASLSVTVDALVAAYTAALNETRLTPADQQKLDDATLALADMQSKMQNVLPKPNPQPPAPPQPPQ